MSSDPSDSIWTRPEPGARGAAHTREGITAAAIAIADAEGFAAVSMRRVAAELGAGTMTLYHYVRNKDELIELIDDAIMGELLIPDDELPPGWREALAEIARRTHATFRRHPWIFEIPPGTEGGPNGVRHFEQSLEAVSGTGLDADDGLDLVVLVDDYVFGSALRQNMTSQATWEELPPDWIEAQLARLPELESGGYPRLQGLYEGRDSREALEQLISAVTDDSRFERGLAVFLDGIENRIEKGWRSN